MEFTNPTEVATLTIDRNPYAHRTRWFFSTPRGEIALPESLKDAQFEAVVEYLLLRGWTYLGRDPYAEGTMFSRHRAIQCLTVRREGDSGSERWIANPRFLCKVDMQQFDKVTSDEKVIKAIRESDPTWFPVVTIVPEGTLLYRFIPLASDPMGKDR